MPGKKEGSRGHSGARLSLSRDGNDVQPVPQTLHGASPLRGCCGEKGRRGCKFTLACVFVVRAGRKLVLREKTGNCHWRSANGRELCPKRNGWPDALYRPKGAH